MKVKDGIRMGAAGESEDEEDPTKKPVVPVKMVLWG